MTSPNTPGTGRARAEPQAARLHQGSSSDRKGGQTLRLLLAIAAWPIGLVMWAVWMFWPALAGSNCPAGGPCALEAVSSGDAVGGIVVGLMIAFGPGVLATRAWWQGRGRST